jgi:predicted ATPase
MNRNPGSGGGGKTALLDALDWRTMTGEDES